MLPTRHRTKIEMISVMDLPSKTGVLQTIRGRLPRLAQLTQL
jgi:hypothetical protein